VTDYGVCVNMLRVHISIVRAVGLKQCFNHIKR